MQDSTLCPRQFLHALLLCWGALCRVCHQPGKRKTFPGCSEGLDASRFFNNFTVIHMSPWVQPKGNSRWCSAVVTVVRTSTCFFRWTHTPKLLVSTVRYNCGPETYYSVCVCVCFLPIHSGHQVRWTYQPRSHRRKVTQDFLSTFFLRFVPLFFSREGFSHSFPSSTVKSNYSGHLETTLDQQVINNRGNRASLWGRRG